MNMTLKRMATMQRMQLAGLELFYKQGYYNTSVDDILKALSLSKGAFYYHFESKEDFFISIIENYLVKKVYGAMIEPLEGQNDPFRAIVNSFEDNLATAVHNEMDYGFVLNNFINEFHGRNETIMQYLKDILKVWEVNLVGLLQRAKTDGLVDRHTDSQGVATYLIASYMGIRTMMVDGNAQQLSYQYLQQLRHYMRSIAPQTLA